MEVFLPTILSSLLGGLVVFAGSYMAMNTRLTRIETKLEDSAKSTDDKIDTLRADVEKHNNLVERMAIVERDMKTSFVRHDENRARIERLEQKQ